MTFTKEQLIAAAVGRIEMAEETLANDLVPLARHTFEIDLELARIALASLEAEAVAYMHRSGQVVMREECCDDKTFAICCKVETPLYTAPPAPVSVPDYPETLPCPVMLEPGLRFGKGVNTRTMLDALQRRAEYHAELEAMTPEQRADHDAGMKEFAAMLQGSQTVSNRDELPPGIKPAPELDSMIKNARLPPSNYPVIPDGWIACSERMPGVGTEIFYFCQDDGLRDCGIVSSSNFSDKGDAQLYVHAEGYDLRFGVDITHWMPLPAAPQQEAE